jgi:hypothetical protein
MYCMPAWSEASEMKVFFSASDLRVIKSVIRYTEIFALEDVEKGIEFCRKYGVLPGKG